MGVNDYGGPTDSLAAVPLGGAGGWAEAVAAALNNSDTPVDARLAAKVSKAGDTMTGSLTIQTTGAAELITDGAASSTSGLRIKQDGITRWLFADDNADRLVLARYDKTTGAWVQSALAVSSDDGRLSLFNEPTADVHAATKQYVDLHAATKEYVDATEAALSFTSPFQAKASHRNALAHAGNMVFAQFSIEATSQVNSTGSSIALGTLPAGYRPTGDTYVAMPCTITDGSPVQAGGVIPALALAYSDGQFRITLENGKSITTTSHIAITGSWRVA